MTTDARTTRGACAYCGARRILVWVVSEAHRGTADATYPACPTQALGYPPERHRSCYDHICRECAADVSEDYHV